LIAEFVGTFFLVATGLGVAMSLSATGGGDLLTVALAHGLAIAIGVTAIGHISGGHLNPAISLAMAVFRQMTARDCVAYVAVQLAGAVAATLALRAAWDMSEKDVIATTPALATVSAGQGMLLVVIATFLLAWTVFAVAVDRDGAYGKLAGLPIGLAVTVGILMIGPATGAALNPARWFGPALVSMTWGDAVIWILGPALGALLAAAAHRWGVRPRMIEV
jgi:MIP family channel proteins